MYRRAKNDFRDRTHFRDTLFGDYFEELRTPLDLCTGPLPGRNKNQSPSSSQTSAHRELSSWLYPFGEENSTRLCGRLQLHLRIRSRSRVLPVPSQLYPPRISNSALLKRIHRRGQSRSRHRTLQADLQLRQIAQVHPHSALFTVIALKFRTHRCGFLSPLSTSLNWPSATSGLPPMFVATITSPLCSEPSTSVTEYSTQYLSVPSATR